MTGEQLASRCYDIQSVLQRKDVAEFENLPLIGMLVSLSLHIRGLPIMEYEKMRMASSHFFKIPTQLFKQIVEKLAEIEFVSLETQGSTIKKVLPTVPFFDDVYQIVGDYSKISAPLNENEQIALTILNKLSESPTEKSNIHSIGAEKREIARNLQIGEQAGYIITKRARGKDILISPLFFSENAELFTELTAAAGAKTIQRLLTLIKGAQGWPMTLIEKTKEINGTKITDGEVKLLKRLAQDGMVKPPSITTPQAGNTNFMFTPAPGVGKLNPSNREIYERAMAILASVRQGQLLPKEYAIFSPEKLLMALKRNGYIGANSEAYDQYHQLATLRIGHLTPSGYGHRFVLNEGEENLKAIDVALSLLRNGGISNMEIDENARIALQKDQTYVESLIASHQLRESESVPLDEETKEELDNIFIKGISK